ncbi:MAG: restriction endonuclease subunit S [Clostridia bacterium]|nr:restriction endonuclease subunit S [Clostridia bacterium]
MARLGDIATYINGYAFKPSDWADTGVPIIRIQDLTGNSYQTNKYKGTYDKKYEVVDGDILISWSASLGVYVWKGEKALLNQHIFKVVFDRTEIDKDFFVHQVRAVLQNATSEAHGATMKHLTKPVFDSLPFYLPSMEEQKNISQKLNSVSMLIETKKLQLEKLDELVKARFVELFGDIKTGGYKFETRKLGKVADVGSSHRVFTTEFVDKGIPFYRGTEIGELAIGKKPENPYRISEEHYDRLASDDTKPQIGDLLMPSICNKGQVWMVDTEEPFYYKDGRVLRISPNRKLFNCKYLEQFMREKTLAEYPKLGSGSTFAEFKIFLLKDIDVLIPPIELQNEFADFVKEVDKSKFEVQQSLKKLETLKKSLMQKYFG